MRTVRVVAVSLFASAAIMDAETATFYMAGIASERIAAVAVGSRAVPLC